MTIPKLFENSVKLYPNNTLVLEKDDSKKYQAITYTDIQKETHYFAKGLLNEGIEHGDRLALLSEGRSEWLISELGMLYIGAINVPLSVKLNELNDLAFRINHSECSQIIVSQRQLSKVREIKDAINRAKKRIPKSGTVRNPDVKVDTNSGEIYPKVPGGIGDSIGNIFDRN